MAATYDQIASQTLASDTASVTFSGIAADWTDLVLLGSTSCTTAATDIRVRYNASSGTNYSATRLIGNGTSASSTRDSSGSSYGYLGFLGTSTTDFTTFQIHIMSYANTNVYKTILSETGQAGAQVRREVSLWAQTAAITSIAIYPGTLTNLRSGSTFSLYGIKAA